MTTTKVYAGRLVQTSNGDEDDLVGLQVLSDRPPKWWEDCAILAEVIQDDIEDYGNYLTVSYWISDEPMNDDERTDALILMGLGEADYDKRYSDYTGYLWTDEELNVGGHDLLEELHQNLGKHLYMEVDYSHGAPTD